MNTNFKLSDYRMNIGGVLLLLIPLFWKSEFLELQIGIVLVSFFYIFFGSLKFRSIRIAFPIFFIAGLFHIYEVNLMMRDSAWLIAGGAMAIELYFLLGGASVLFLGGFLEWGIKKVKKESLKPERFAS